MRSALHYNDAKSGRSLTIDQNFAQQLPHHCALAQIWHKKSQLTAGLKKDYKILIKCRAAFYDVNLRYLKRFSRTSCSHRS